VLLVVAFIGGAMVMTVGVGKLMAYVIDSTHGELKTMYGADVPPAKRAQVDAALNGISHDLAADKLPYAKIEPLLTTMRDTMDDKKITNAEADQLLARVQEVRAPRSAQAPRPSPGPSLRSAPPSPGGRGK